MDQIDIQEMKNVIDGLLDLAVPHAKAIRAYFNALIDQGFNEDQALRIVMRHGVIPPYGNAPEIKGG